MPVIVQGLIAVACLALAVAAGWYLRGYHDHRTGPKHRTGRRWFPAPVDGIRPDLAAGKREPDYSQIADQRLGRHAAGVVQRKENEQ